MIKRFITLVIGVLAVVALAAGCGDDEADGETITTSSLSKAEYVKRANELCNQADARGSKEAAELYEENGSSLNTIAEVVSTIFVPQAEAQVEQLSELGAPKGDEKKIEAIFAVTKQGIAELDDTGKKALVELTPKLRQVAKLTDQYGIEACAFGYRRSSAFSASGS